MQKELKIINNVMTVKLGPPFLQFLDKLLRNFFRRLNQL